jgi:hypothetical protein
MSFKKILVTSKLFQYQLYIYKTIESKKKPLWLKHLNGGLSMREICNNMELTCGMKIIIIIMIIMIIIIIII